MLHLCYGTVQRRSTRTECSGVCDGDEIFDVLREVGTGSSQCTQRALGAWVERHQEKSLVLQHQNHVGVSCESRVCMRQRVGLTGPRGTGPHAKPFGETLFTPMAPQTYMFPRSYGIIKPIGVRPSRDKGPGSVNTTDVTAMHACVDLLPRNSERVAHWMLYLADPAALVAFRRRTSQSTQYGPSREAVFATVCKILGIVKYSTWILYFGDQRNALKTISWQKDQAQRVGGRVARWQSTIG